MPTLPLLIQLKVQSCLTQTLPSPLTLLQASTTSLSPWANTTHLTTKGNMVPNQFDLPCLEAYPPMLDPIPVQSPMQVARRNSTASFVANCSSISAIWLHKQVWLQMNSLVARPSLATSLDCHSMTSPSGIVALLLPAIRSPYPPDFFPYQVPVLSPPWSLKKPPLVVTT